MPRAAAAAAGPAQPTPHGHTQSGRAGADKKTGECGEGDAGPNPMIRRWCGRGFRPGGHGGMDVGF